MIYEAISIGFDWQWSVGWLSARLKDGQHQKGHSYVDDSKNFLVLKCFRNLWVVELDRILLDPELLNPKP